MHHPTPEREATPMAQHACEQTSLTAPHAVDAALSSAFYDYATHELGYAALSEGALYSA